MASQTFTDPELGVVRLCRGCGEIWPLDDEFWFFNPRKPGRALGRCKACWSERVRDEQGRARFAAPVMDIGAAIGEPA